MHLLIKIFLGVVIINTTLLYAQQDSSTVIFRPAGEVGIICGFSIASGSYVGLRYHISDKYSLDASVGYLFGIDYSLIVNSYLNNQNSTGVISITFSYWYLPPKGFSTRKQKRFLLYVQNWELTGDLIDD